MIKFKETKEEEEGEKTNVSSIYAALCNHCKFFSPHEIHTSTQTG